MNDAMLMSAFEDGTLEPSDVHHREHVRLAWLYLRRYGRAGAERRLIAGLRCLAERAGRPDRFDEALTRAWVRRIEQESSSAPATTFDVFIAMRPELLDRGGALRRDARIAAHRWRSG